MRVNKLLILPYPFDHRTGVLMLARVFSCAVIGLDGFVIEVEFESGV
ncbi:MAG: hypothetical protein K0B06_12175 [Brevefilum sp.]|nr:hypothetical protein [Brevefilum sp.]